MKTARIIVLFFVFFVFLSGAVSEEKIREDLTFDLFESGNEKADYDSLLEGYKKNSTELERLYIKLKQAEISSERVDLGQSPVYSFSTGTGKITLSGNTPGFSFSPGGSIEIPALNGFTLKGEVPMNFSGESGVTVESGSVSISGDIFSSKRLNREKALLESRHSLSVAERNYLKGGDSVEKTFLTELKEAYQQGSTVLDSRETYLEKVVDFETVRVQGFSPSSAKYKTAFLEKESAASDVEKNLRNLRFLLETLSEKCGTELSFLPGFIPVPGLVDFDDFKEETFLELEEADYNNLLGNISRKSNKTWSLSAEAGYDYTGSGLSGSYSGQETHEISAGIKAAFSGLELGTGVSIPLSEKGEPGITISAGWDSFSGRDKKLEKESENYDLLTELLDIQDAKESYRNAKDTYQRQKDDLLWSLKILEEQCSYYEQIGNDTREAYEKGLVSYQDFLESSNLYNKIKIQYILAVINMRLYNIEVRSLFSGDTDL